MALDLNFDIYTRRNSTQLIFKETTGTYSLSNTSGWGSPNDSLSSVSSWVVSITLPNSTTLYSFNNPINLPSDNNANIIINPIDIGSTTGLIPDGVYEIQYEVITTNNTYKKVLRIPIFSNVSCCVKRMALKIKPGCCCDDKFIQEFNLAQALLISMCENAEFGNETMFNNYLNKLQLLCNWNNCGCGC